MATFAVSIIHFVALYRARVDIPPRQAAAAMLAAMSMQWTVARAVANGIVRAFALLGAHAGSKPLVVRLEGTNVDLGKKILAESGLKIMPADNLGDAAEKITDAVKKAA